MGFLDSLLDNIKGFTSKNAPAILTGLGIAGTVSAVVLAVKATPQAHRDILDAESERTEPLKPVEKVKLTWRYYIPTGIVTIATVGVLIGSQSVSSRRQAALMSMYAVTETSFREYREKTKELIGEKKESEVRDEIAKEHLDGVPMVNSEVIITGKGDHLCFDSMSSRYFRSDIETIRKAVNDINSKCLTDTYASQNDFYALIGLPPAVFGEEHGWRFDHLMEVHFSSHLDETNTPALSLEYYTSPIRGYYKIQR